MTPRTEFVGTPEMVVDAAERWFLKGAADGFIIRGGDFDAFSRLCIPLLQERGLFRERYEAETLRGNLGLPPTVNRYAAARADAVTGECSMSHDNVLAFGPAAHFYECPRWHAGRWWASDMRGGTVYSFSGEGEARIELEIDDRPGGIGWTAAGELLVVSMEAKALLVREKGGRGIARRIELGHLSGGIVGFFNDMAVRPHGQVYIGFDAYPFETMILG